MTSLGWRNLDWVLFYVCLISIGFIAGLGSACAAETLQVKGISVSHREGQTFITWEETFPLAFPDNPSAYEMRRLRRNATKRQLVHYRIYRASHKIDSIEGLEPIGEVGPLSAWNLAFYGRSKRRTGPAFRFVISDAEHPLPVNTGLYVHNPNTAGFAYYAVTAVSRGKETRQFSADNATRSPIEEEVGQGAPVLQRTVKPKSFNYVRGATIHYYVRWEAPPNASVENVARNYVVGIPTGAKSPAPVGLHLHGYNGNLRSGYGWWYNETSAILVASNQELYDWWTGYHENFHELRRLPNASQTAQMWQAGVVRPYTQRRLLSFLNWLAEHGPWEIDLRRTFTAGNSMGGSGSIMLGLRHSEKIAWTVSWTGVHIPARSAGFHRSYAKVFGPREYNVLDEDGTPVWDHFDDAQYLRTHQDQDMPFITFSNGKNDHGIGWPQAVEFVRALQEARQPHLFSWGMHGHSERARMPAGGGQHDMLIDIRVDQSLPAFTGCSLDGELGSARQVSADEWAKRVAGAGGVKKKADRFDGDSQGQINAYLYWRTADIVDEKHRWAITIALHDKAPASEALVDVTPRRLQKLRVETGDRFSWSNTDTYSGRVVQTAEIAADDLGLVTLPQVIVSKGANRVRLVRILN